MKAVLSEAQTTGLVSCLGLFAFFQLFSVTFLLQRKGGSAGEVQSLCLPLPSPRRANERPFWHALARRGSPLPSAESGFVSACLKI